MIRRKLVVAALKWVATIVTAIATALATISCAVA